MQNVEDTISGNPILYMVMECNNTNNINSNCIWLVLNAIRAKYIHREMFPITIFLYSYTMLFL